MTTSTLHCHPPARLLASSLLLLAAARCDCPGPVAFDDAGTRLHTDARIEAAVLDHLATDALASDLTAADREDGDRGGHDGSSGDLGAVDSSNQDGSPGDLGAVDSAVRDGDADDIGSIDSGGRDGSPGDLGAVDSAVRDGEADDLGSIDSGARDATAAADSGAATGLSVPCQNGPGWTLFRFHYDDSYSARLDVWDASCDYSLAPGSACNVVPVLTETLVHDGYALLVSGNSYIRARFDVGGLSFSQAAVYVQARSYATSSSTSIEVWSPLYGSVFGGPVDNDWEFDWYGMDWSGHLDPGDDPDLTAIQIYAYQGSDSLAVHAVELCVE
jgi:hypothetical protein